MDVCPKCGSKRIFRSRTRSAFERLRRQLTTRRPYRCHACGWRGWALDGVLAVGPGDAPDAPVSQPDLRAIDAALAGSEKDGPAEE